MEIKNPKEYFKEADEAIRSAKTTADQVGKGNAKATIGLGMAVLESTQYLVENIYKSTRMLNDSVKILNKNIEEFNKSSSKLTKDLVFWTKALVFAAFITALIGIINKLS